MQLMKFLNSFLIIVLRRFLISKIRIFSFNRMDSLVNYYANTTCIEGMWGVEDSDIFFVRIL